MAATTTTPPPITHKTTVCFSFAAYSKHLITHLHRHSSIPVDHGLTETELSTIESSFNFSFPPDLRSILREGLPIGHGFPNWRSSSPEQLKILINLPITGLHKAVSQHKFWHCRWGNRPEKEDEAVELATRLLKNSPVLVPVYGNCYLPTTPCLLGNPVFYVNGSEVKLCSYDVVGLFQRVKFKERVNCSSVYVGPLLLGHFLSAPVWAATEARRIEFWTELAERGGVETGKRWWCGDELGRCMEDVRSKLKRGGWKDEDLDEMMMTSAGFNNFDKQGVKIEEGEINGHVNIDRVEKRSFSVTPSSSSSSVVSWSSEDDVGGGCDGAVVVKGVEGVGTVLSRMLLRGGWSMGDVMETLGCLTDEDDCKVEN